MPLWLMNGDELELIYRIAVAYEELTEKSDRQRAIAVFGEAQAIRYESLQRKANSNWDFAGADAASAEIARMEATLTEAQERHLFGIGEVETITPELVREYIRALNSIDYDSPEALGRSLVNPLIKLGDYTSPYELPQARQIAFAQVRAGLEYATAQGWPYERVLTHSINGIRRRYTDSEDGDYMASPVVRALVEAGYNWAALAQVSLQ